jgi:integrase
MFKWGVAYEGLEPNISYALQAIENLKAGRTQAKEYRVVPPVPDEIVEKTLPFCSPIVRDMIQVQRYAGLRPEEVRNLRGCDINRSDKEIWRYEPYTHKMEHRKKKRPLAIGPKAQAILTPYLIEKADCPEAFLFSPADSIRLFRAERRAKRKTKVQPSQISRRMANPKRRPREQYDRHSYNHAIGTACIKAGVAHWYPNQLRHSAGTEIREKFGLEFAQAVLGHAHANTTEIYAKLSFEKAAEVMKKIG